MKRLATILVSISLLLSGCSTSANIKASDGSTVSGSLINGSISYSAGAACKPATPNGTTPTPIIPPTTVKTICEGASCVHMLVADTGPTCYTQVATVQGTDVTTYFGWLMAFFGAGITAAATGS